MTSQDLLRRYIGQRLEFGEQQLVLDSLSARQLMDVLGRKQERELDAPDLIDDGGDGPGAAPDLVQLGDLDAIREIALVCPRCRLAETRTRVVFGEGSPSAEVMVVGEAPGAEEDRTGRPFVGRAGKLLDLLLASIGFTRESVYICNVLKCRPPGNRNPQADEIEACRPYLLRQVDLIHPRAVLAVGTFAAQTLLDTTVTIGRLRGGSHEYRGIPLVPTYHPAALLRNPSWIRPVWDDLQRLRAILDGG